MSELKQFRLPDVGEGLTEADILKWLVHPGDTITLNQPFVEIETAKSAVELPSPYAGVVAELLVSEGATVDVGAPIMSVQVGGETTAERRAVPGDQEAAEREAVPGDQEAAEREAAPGAQEAAQLQATAERHAAPARQAVLVGYGVSLGRTTRRPRRGAATRAPSDSRKAAIPATPAAPAANGGKRAILAKPPVRKFAKDLGIDLAQLTGTGPAGSITREDVQAAVAGTQDAPTDATAWSSATDLSQLAATGPTGLAAVPREERIPIRGVRKHTAAAVTASAFTAPHVTEFLQIDVSETMAATAWLKSLPEFADTKVSPLLLVAKALLIAVRRNPLVNSSWDDAAQEIVVKHYVNLGIAAATDRGLVVPNVKDAHAMSLPQLAQALADLTATARAGKATPADLSGGTITITNVGVFGVDTGTPIITPGEAAILAFGQVKDAPWVHDGALAVRQVCTLSLSFDHRIIDGDDGSAVLRDIGAMLTDPLRMLAWS